jgi:hypothetical protein
VDNLAPLNRTLDQELAALVRGASMECLVCGEFVLRVAGALACPECRSIVAEDLEAFRADPDARRLLADSA